MSKVVVQNTKQQRPKSSKNPQPMNDKPKKDGKEEVKSVSELQAKIQALEFRIEYLEANLDPKVFEKKAGLSEQQAYTLFTDSLKSAEETICKLRNGLTSKDNTEELNKAKEEIKKLNDMIRQKETAEQNLNRELKKAESERDALQKIQTESRSEINSLSREKQEKDITIKNQAEDIKRLRNNIPKLLSESHKNAENKFEKAESSEKALKKKEKEIESLTEKVRNLENATKGPSTEEFNKANEEIKKLNTMLKQKATAEENLKHQLQKAQSERDELLNKQTETRIEHERLTRDSQGNTSLQQEIIEKEADIQRQLMNARNDLEVKDEEIRRLKETTETEKKQVEEKMKSQEEEKMKSLRTELESARNELEIKQKDILRLQDEKNAKEVELKTLKTKGDSSNNSTKANTGSHEEISNMKRQIADKDTELGKKTSDIEGLKKEIATLRKASDVALKKMQTQDDKLKTIEEEYKMKLENKDETINTLRKEKTMEKTAPPGRDDVGVIKHQLTQATLEIDELKSRLSKMVGENLTNNNPNITDLSDENRPTKLAEIYSEMYDNEWTDAFEELEKQGSKEHAIISELLTILQDTVKFCGKMAEQYIEHLQNSASKLQEKTSPTNKFQKLHLLKELRKSYAPSLAGEVFSLYVKEKNLKFGKQTKVEAYTKSCIRLCWLISVQDPAVVIDEVKTPSKFDGDRYRQYTKSGTTMEFVVWPTLLLHAGGPILMKGVAQCK